MRRPWKIACDFLVGILFFAGMDFLCGIRATDLWQAVVMGALAGTMIVYGRETPYA